MEKSMITINWTDEQKEKAIQKLTEFYRLYPTNENIGHTSYSAEDGLFTLREIADIIEDSIKNTADAPRIGSNKQ